MPRVLLLATTTGYQTRMFGDAAERLGVELVLATDRCDMLDDPWRDRAIPIRFYDERRSVVAIVRAARSNPIDGMLVVGDRPTVVAALAAEALGLPGQPPAAVRIARNKQATRERLAAAGLLSPWFLPASVSSDADELAGAVSYPCVVKPLALSGSRGVMRVDDRSGFLAAFHRLRALLAAPEIRGERDRAHDALLVEGFIEGREYAVEGLLNDGVLHVLAIFDKPDPLDGPFFEETLYVTPSEASDATKRDIESAIGCAATAIGLRHGPVHAECRVNTSGVFVLEVAARPIGGLCARALRFMPPGNAAPTERVPLEELLLRHAIGERVDGWSREPRASGVMMIPIPRRGVLRGVEGVDAARTIAGIDDVRITAKADQLLLPLPEGASYLGFIFGHGETSADVNRTLREAHARLAFRIDPQMPMVQSRHG